MRGQQKSENDKHDIKMKNGISLGPIPGILGILLHSKAWKK